MELPPDPGRRSQEVGSPDALLDALRAHPEWDERRRDDALDELVARFPAERLVAAVRPRLRDLGGPDAESLLRLVEANATQELLRELAEALAIQPGLAPELAWQALALLDDAGLLEAFPELLERWDELNEALDEEGSLDELVEQLERDPDDAWLAVQGLEAVEPEVRAEIVAGLVRAPLGPGLIEFLRLLCFVPDDATRSAALDALAAREALDPRLEAAWSSIAAEHPDREVVARARLRLGRRDHRGGMEIAVFAGGDGGRPQLLRSLVTALDGSGQGSIVLSSSLGSSRVTAAFLCDVRQGICDVVGREAGDSPQADADFHELMPPPGIDALDAPGLALGLLAGSLLLCGPRTTADLRRWLEKTAGPDLAPGPLVAPLPGWDPQSLPFAEMPDRSEAVLSSCPSWVDDSDLTYELAEELLLRSGGAPPDPRRDTGAYRFLFERRLHGRLELFRRMLLWMASFWEAAGDEELGKSALALAWQLSDAQHAVPSHPFTVALTTRSLAAAQATLRLGADARRGKAENPGPTGRNLPRSELRGRE
jgi:hypothetical protein